MSTDLTRRQNVVAVNGGAVHAAKSCTETPFPACRTGAQTQRRTRYRVTGAPVTCRRCGGAR